MNLEELKIKEKKFLKTQREKKKSLLSKNKKKEIDYEDELKDDGFKKKRL